MWGVIGARRISKAGLLVALVLLAVGAGCGHVEEETSSEEAQFVERSSSAEEHRAAAVPVTPSRCPSGHPACRSAEGRIVFVERVDPDGDGDAHFVIVDAQGITLSGLTAIDVRKALRPHPLPGVGNTISVAGPVQTGSYGQSQIHALELHVGHRH
jgi:hypothetical protein